MYYIETASGDTIKNLIEVDDLKTAHIVVAQELKKISKKKHSTTSPSHGWFVTLYSGKTARNIIHEFVKFPEGVVCLTYNGIEI